jgi:hypothetical protein
MRETHRGWFKGATIVALSLLLGLALAACDGDDGETSGADTSAADTAASEDAAAEEVAAEPDWTCLEQACVNPDGNTHDDCGCDASYCIPDEASVEMAGLTRLTCTAIDCDQSDCPTGFTCKEIPAFAIELMAGQGVEMPTFICAPTEE